MYSFLPLMQVRDLPHAIAFMIITLPAFQLAMGIFGAYAMKSCISCAHRGNASARYGVASPLRSNVEDTEAKLRNGVLTITLPKAGNEGGVLFFYCDNL